jgi:hypothetical protein
MGVFPDIFGESKITLSFDSVEDRERAFKELHLAHTHYKRLEWLDGKLGSDDMDDGL